MVELFTADLLGSYNLASDIRTESTVASFAIPTQYQNRPDTRVIHHSAEYFTVHIPVNDAA